MMAGRPGNHYLAAKRTGCGRIPTEGCPTAVDKLATLLDQATEVIRLAEVGSAMCAMVEFNRIQSVIESVVSGGNIDSDSEAQHRSRIKQFGYLNSRFRAPTKYKLNVTFSRDIRLIRSMKTCLNISATSWPTMRAPKTVGARHSRYNRGCAFRLGLSMAPFGQTPEGNLDGLGVSR